DEYTLLRAPGRLAAGRPGRALNERERDGQTKEEGDGAARRSSEHRAILAEAALDPVRAVAACSRVRSTASAIRMQFPIGVDGCDPASRLHSYIAHDRPRVHSLRAFLVRIYPFPTG